MNRKDRVRYVLLDYAVSETSEFAAIEELDRIYGVLPDDGEALTGKWLKEIGGRRPMAVASQEVFVFGMWHSGFFQVQAELIGGEWDVTVFGMGSPAKTRYQFRRLCEALGVELKERKDGE